MKNVLVDREVDSRDYLMRLKPENLILPFYTEAALVRITYIPDGLHD